METSNVQDLADKLDEVTAGKTPGEQSPEASKNANFWNEKDEEEPEPTKQSDPAQPNTPNAEKPLQKISTEIKEASANSVIGMLDIALRILTPAYNKKFYKKFTKEEVLKLDKLQYLHSDNITDPDDLALRNKFDKLYKKHQKKMGDLPLNSTESKDLRTQLMAYMTHKNKVIPPEVGLIFTGVIIVGNRAIDLMTD